MSAPWLLLAALFGASLLGSLHCVGMCGGFVAAVSGPCRSGGGRELRPMIAYHLARGLAYVGLGALAGLFGAGLDASGAWLGLQRVAGPLMGITLIVLALTSLWSARAPVGPLVSITSSAPEPRGLARLRLRLTRAIAERGTKAGAAAGLLSALLPCGWLWSYVVVAASTGQALHGALAMAAFWAGGLPALVSVGLLAGGLARRLGRHAPKISAALMLTLGVASLMGKLSLPVPAPASPSSDSLVGPHTLPQDAPCH